MNDKIGAAAVNPLRQLADAMEARASNPFNSLWRPYNISLATASD